MTMLAKTTNNPSQKEAPRNPFLIRPAQSREPFGENRPIKKAIYRQNRGSPRIQKTEAETIMALQKYSSTPSSSEGSSSVGTSNNPTTSIYLSKSHSGVIIIHNQTKANEISVDDLMKIAGSVPLPPCDDSWWQDYEETPINQSTPWAPWPPPHTNQLDDKPEIIKSQSEEPKVMPVQPRFTSPEIPSHSSDHQHQVEVEVDKNAQKERKNPFTSRIGPGAGYRESPIMDQMLFKGEEPKKPQNITVEPWINTNRKLGFKNLKPFDSASSNSKQFNRQKTYFRTTSFSPIKISNIKLPTSSDVSAPSQGSSTLNPDQKDPPNTLVTNNHYIVGVNSHSPMNMMFLRSETVKFVLGLGTFGIVVRFALRWGWNRGR